MIVFYLRKLYCQCISSVAPNSPHGDKLFGLAIVKFGREGALGVGSRLGGLGFDAGMGECFCFIVLFVPV